MNNVLIIAEAGINHNGDCAIAKRLIDVAAHAGADFIKFQTFKAEKLVTATTKKAAYQKKNSSDYESQLSMLKKLELSYDDQREIAHYCTLKEIQFLSTPFDEESADFLHELVPFFKVPSGELTNLPFLKHLVLKKKPLVISTGMSSLKEVKITVDFVRNIAQSIGFDCDGVFNIGNLSILGLTVLHCTTAYPTQVDQVNLLAMQTIQKEIGVAVGYSDHTLTIEVPVAAVALGAMVIEKHFTLDRDMPGPDHFASLMPDELEQMITYIRNVSRCMGNGKKRILACERKTRALVRKSVHFTKALAKGAVICRSDLVCKRPGTGIAPKDMEKIVGKTLMVDVVKDQLTGWDDVS